MASEESGFDLGFWDFDNGFNGGQNHHQGMLWKNGMVLAKAALKNWTH